MELERLIERRGDLELELSILKEKIQNKREEALTKAVRTGLRVPPAFQDWVKGWKSVKIIVKGSKAVGHTENSQKLVIFLDDKGTKLVRKMYSGSNSNCDWRGESLVIYRIWEGKRVALNNDWSNIGELLSFIGQPDSCEEDDFARLLEDLFTFVDSYEEKYGNTAYGFSVGDDPLGSFELSTPYSKKRKLCF